MGMNIKQLSFMSGGGILSRVGMQSKLQPIIQKFVQYYFKHRLSVVYPV